MPEDREDAFAETVAPTQPRTADLSTDETIAAGTAPPPPRADGGPELPVVEPGLYETGDELARGGMGRILAATDRRLGRTVALKELLAAAPDAAARFRREALITARLQHPAIVPVYEAGRWPGGEPFYAMKLVAGRPLDRVIAGCKTLEDRLALLPSVIAVCDAIAYAHSQRIVHRDLKPANVLVGDFGETVVIDWGLAKDLDAEESIQPETIRERPARRAAAPTTTDASTLTVAGAVMGTPAYMPPEQARGDTVDERADVFSLGAMLYHVLAGAPPYAAKSATDVIAHAIAGKVVPLKQRAARAPADLAAIVERAMAQEPAARYPTARELADELRRFQTGQLVGAHRYSTWERIARFVRRHRAAVTIGGVALVAFVVLGTIAVRRIVAERDRAEAARTVAERRRAAAERLVDYMVVDMRDRLDAVGQLALMAGLGESVRDYYADLSDLPGGMPAADVDRMARALDILGAAEQKAGDLDAALATFEDARARLRALVAADPDAPEAPRRQGAIAHATVVIGQIHQARGRIGDALAAYGEAIATYAEARAEAPRDRDLLRGAADAHDRVGDLHRNRGDAEAAIGDYARARGLRQDALDLGAAGLPRDEELAIRYDLSTSAMKLGSAEQARGATRAALDHYASAVAIREALVAAAPDRAAFQHGLTFIRNTQADLLREAGRLEEARAAFAASSEILDGLLRRDPDNTEWRRDRGNTLANLGFVLHDLGDARGALDAYARSLDNHAQLRARDPENTAWQMDVTRTLLRRGDAHLHLGELAAARAAYEEALAIRRALVARDPGNPPWRRALAWAHHKLAGVLAAAGDRGAAREAAAEAHGLRAALVDAAPGHAGYRNELALSELALARLGDAARAERAIELARALVDADPENLEWKETLAGALIARAEARGAADDARAALALAAGAPASTTWQVLRAEAHAAAGERAEARAIVAALAADGRLPHDQLPLARRLGVR